MGLDPDGLAMNFYIKKVNENDYPEGTTVRRWANGKKWGVFMEGFKYPHFMYTYRQARGQLQYYLKCELQGQCHDFKYFEQIGLKSW